MTDTIDEQLPVFVVTGPNWTCEIQLDEDDASIPVEEQAIEAITKALETVKQVSELTSIQLSGDDTEAFIGPVIHSYLKGTNPDEGHFVASFVALANAGFYKESIVLQAAWIKEFEKAAKANEENKNAEDLKNFDKLKKETEEKLTKRGAKPKAPNKKKKE